MPALSAAARASLLARTLKAMIGTPEASASVTSDSEMPPTPACSTRATTSSVPSLSSAPMTASSEPCTSALITSGNSLRPEVLACAIICSSEPRMPVARAKTSDRKEFPLIIKADVQGSLEAIIGSLDKMATDEVTARVLHAGVGGISGSDVTLAEASGVPIIAFNVRANKEAREAAERSGIEIRYYNIIYDLVDDVKKAMSGLLAPTLRETMLGNAQILEIFKVSKVGDRK